MLEGSNGWFQDRDGEPWHWAGSYQHPRDREAITAHGTYYDFLPPAYAEELCAGCVAYWNRHVRPEVLKMIEKMSTTTDGRCSDGETIHWSLR